MERSGAKREEELSSPLAAGCEDAIFCRTPFFLGGAMFVISGATGHVGSVVAKELLAKKQKVKVIARDAAKGAAWSKQGAELAVGSLEDQTFLTGALRGATGFFAMLPPPPSTTKDFHATQRRVADAMAGAVKASGVPQVVMLSSVGADLPAGTGPIQDLHYLEVALRASGATVTVIRAGYFQENVAMSLAPAREQGVLPNFMPSADAKFSMIATKDIGALAVQYLVEKPAKGEVVDLHGPDYSIRETAEKLGAALGKKIQIVDIPQSNWVSAMTQAGFPQPFAEVFAEMYAAMVSGTVRPRGDRLVQGKTTLDETVRMLVG
jgi:uncharacterized protein YbjT (DUF2867 family)